jgi:hypothetical protein
MGGEKATPVAEEQAPAPKPGTAVHIDTGTILQNGMESVVLVIRAGSITGASPDALSISSVSDFAAMLDCLPTAKADCCLWATRPLPVKCDS